MTYKEFENIFSAERMQRYLIATRNNRQKAVGLYRGNIRVAQEMFAVVSCFEVALRNRIAHHEPICFVTGQPNVNMAYLIERYNKILRLFNWMEIDSNSLLYGLDHVKNECQKLEKQNPIV